MVNCSSIKLKKKKEKEKNRSANVMSQDRACGFGKEWFFRNLISVSLSKAELPKVRMSSWMVILQCGDRCSLAKWVWKILSYQSYMGVRRAVDMLQCATVALREAVGCINTIFQVLMDVALLFIIALLMRPVFQSRNLGEIS